MRVRFIMGLTALVIIFIASLTGCINDNENINNDESNYEGVNNGLTSNKQEDISGKVLKIKYNPIAFDSVKYEDDEMQLGMSYDMNYTALENIHVNLIQEIEADMVLADYSVPLIEEVADGYIIGLMEIDGSEALSRKEDAYRYKVPVIYKIGKDGSLKWKQTYPYVIEGGEMANLVTYEDGRILFSISCWPSVSMGAPTYQKAYLIQCDPEGNELWQQTYDDYIGSLLKYIFITENEEIISVGEWFANDNQQTIKAKASDIVVTRFDPAGMIIDQKSFGGDNYEYCQGAEYDLGGGIVITGWTRSGNSDLAISGIENENNAYIAYIDKSLTIKWVINPEDDERFNYAQIKIKEDMIYTVGNCYNDKMLLGDMDEQDDKPVMFWQKINVDGNEVIKGYETDELMRWSNISVLENNIVVLGGGNQNQGMIIIYDEEGKEIKRIDNLNYTPHSIIPTSDQGFIVKAVRSIKMLPQPLYISSIWMDVEVILTKYNGEYDIEWRKTYDDYKDEIRVDFVLPFGY